MISAQINNELRLGQKESDPAMNTRKKIYIGIAFVSLALFISFIVLISMPPKRCPGRDRTKIYSLSQAIYLFQISYGEYPAPHQWIEQLVSPPDGGKSFLDGRELPKDCTGEPYAYLDSKNHFEICSKGEDQFLSTEDDLCLRFKKSLGASNKNQPQANPEVSL